ncbi:amidase signature domain-containing protein [Lophiotrema nucula]|uniref:Amidase signature domain-containing protein n=1 Tax=Lophiotrema nucula TaxID=690887 RepID=A0A6A5ZBX4_9PLEO|nr:amidase signature domain-containing protein [Lophiotrema nucula]
METDSNRFEGLNAVINDNDGSWMQRIAVPSRCYSRPTLKLPLHGVRVSVKDNFALAGLKTGLQNRAFFATYEAEENTADYIKRLIDLGAIIVGKTKLSSFASGEKPCDWWEFLCPFNARADGHLNPGQSTTGGAASIGAYEWLDISIGSDSFGSVRVPAAQNGAYGIRLTTGLSAPTKGLYPNSPGFDMIGFLGRDLDEFLGFARASLNNEVKNIKKETWNANPPPGSNGRKFHNFTNGLVYNPFYYDGYHGTQSFRNDYQKRFNKKPYVTPHMQMKWDVGAGISREEYEATLLDLQVFRQWFHDNILKPQSRTGSTALLILPVGPGNPVFRDEIVESPPRFGIDQADLGAIAALPQIVLPIGHIPYDSPKSGQTEYLPIAGSIAGASGSDLMLLNLAREALVSADWPTKVSPGRFLFELSGPQNANPTNDAAGAPRIEISSRMRPKCIMS